MNRIISTVFLIATIFVNYLSSSGALGDNMMNLREIFPFEYMPVGATFGIARGAIYISLVMRCIRSWTADGQRSQTLKDISHWFWISSVINILWIYSTARERYAISVVLISCLMFVLRQILAIISASAEKTTPGRIMSIPFGLYAGWVTMATVVIGTGQFVYSFGSLLPLTTGWTIGAIFLGICVAGRLFYIYRNVAQLAITIVALFGIGLSIFG